MAMQSHPQPRSLVSALLVAVLPLTNHALQHMTIMFLLAIPYVLVACLSTVADAISDFNWDLVTPSTALNYTDCYDNHRCARLLVPLDWLDPDNEARVTVAIVARRAVVSEDDPSFGGTINVNPGGPGSPGIDFVLGVGSLIQGITDGNNKYEILSFDPRGVGRTTPSSNCQPNEYARGNRAIEERAIGTLDGGEAVLRRRMSLAKGFADLCSKINSKDDVRNFMSTTSVARDMARIVDEIQALRDRTGQVQSNDAKLELRAEDSKPARINYWGWSYGTDLGNYFASMFPGRVDRMILEGVQDVRDYAAGTWLKFGDAEKIFDYFWDTCYHAADRCALYQETDTGPEDARARFDEFLRNLEQNPPSHATFDTSFTIINREDVMLLVFANLAQPLLRFPSLAATLSEAMAGDFSSLYSQLGQPNAESCQLPTTSAYTWLKDAQAAIACGDAEQQNMTFADYWEYTKGIAAGSENFWQFFADIRLACLNWPFRPRDRFTGPWETPEHDPRRVEGKPTAPLFFISSRYDVFTPSSNAAEMSKFHAGSKLLVQDTYGHGTLLSPSKCRDAYVKRYFETGELPPDDMMCDSDCVPFQDCEFNLDLKQLGVGQYGGYRYRVVPSAWF
ncbi:hypothetical protein NLG97_g10106 [Lecanicillium saksenae]|uniref:Uncharacterized protein n=1 Tax=Lecanicillium saksenae TaxID=468837 RepID=A0ACC1QI29_9HYPO|nr:hypothetical protein NLG97_g10106 [Lecanicillium saksenae]